MPTSGRKAIAAMKAMKAVKKAGAPPDAAAPAAPAMKAMKAMKAKRDVNRDQSKASSQILSCLLVRNVKIPKSLRVH